MVVGNDKLASFDDLFGITSEPDTKSAQMISVDKIVPSSRNPFKVEENSEMDQLVASIRENGILMPLILRASDDSDTYDLIAGHRRLFAAKLAGLTEVPADIREMTDEEADIIMVDTNLNREHISFSEKAFAYKMKYNAIKKKVGRNWEEKGDNASDSNIKRSTEQIAAEMGVSDRTVKNYIRLTELVPYLLDLVDSKELTIKAGVQISYLEKSVQNIICDFLQREQAVIDEEQAKILRESFEGVDQIELAEIYQALAKQSDSVPHQPKYKPVFRVSSKARKKYFPAEYDEHDIESVIQDLLESWAREHNPDFTKE